MKKKLSYIAAILLAFCMVCSVKTKASAQTTDYKKVEVNETDELLNASDGENGIVEAVPVREDRDYGTDSFYYTFTLKQPSYVKIEDTASVFSFNFLGDLELYLSKSKMFKNKLISGWANGTDYSYATILDAGTYYVKINIIYKDHAGSQEDYINDPVNMLSIYAEPLEHRQKDAGDSKKKAVVMKSGKTYMSQIGEFSRQKYFKIDLKNTTDLVLQCSSTTKEGWDKQYITVSNGILWSVYNEKGDKLDYCQTNYYDNFDHKRKANYVTFHLKNLKPGTYYVIASNNEKPANSEGSFEAICTPMELKAPSVWSVKRTSDRTMTVRLKRRVPEVTGYQIQYSTKRNMSGAKTLKIRKNTQLKQVVKGLRAGKTYYVQVRSYYKDADGAVFYGSYGKRYVCK